MKTTMATLFTLVGIVILNLTACGFGTDNALEETSWELSMLGDSRPLAGTMITIHFEDGGVNGRSGCNQYSGSYVADGSRLTITQLVMTEMACMEPVGVMEQETAYLTALGNAGSFEIVDGELQISVSGQDALIFQPVE